MAFIDELDFFAKAGKGGDGVVRWRHEKYKEFSGPAGGNGGKGGDMYVLAVRDIAILAKHRHEKRYVAEDGAPGGNDCMHGRGGEDFVLPLPIGSVITNMDTGETFELLEEGQKILLLKGGIGGLGNDHFKGPANRTPKESTPGRPGQDGTFHVELELIADAGFIGLPNAGKSSLLNALTNAEAKVGSYQFTTLDPNLGVMYGYVLADIPGLIEGASEGKGLGHKFLRHIKRTELLLHCISLEQDNVSCEYDIIRKEIEKYENLSDKPEVVILTKTDTVSSAQVKKARSAIFQHNSNILDVTILDDASVEKLRKAIIGFLQ